MVLLLLIFLAALMRFGECQNCKSPAPSPMFEVAGMRRTFYMRDFQQSDRIYIIPPEVYINIMMAGVGVRVRGRGTGTLLTAYAFTHDRFSATVRVRIPAGVHLHQTHTPLSNIYFLSFLFLFSLKMRSMKSPRTIATSIRGLFLRTLNVQGHI